MYDPGAPQPRLKRVCQSPSLLLHRAGAPDQARGTSRRRGRKSPSRRGSLYVLGWIKVNRRQQAPDHRPVHDDSQRFLVIVLPLHSSHVRVAIDRAAIYGHEEHVLVQGGPSEREGTTALVLSHSDPPSKLT